MEGGPARGSTRDNGLRCANYVAISDIDPRVADSLLAALRDAGIAAYATPAGGTLGGAMELRMPTRPVDRLWVDDQQVERARAVVADEERSEDAEPAGLVTSPSGDLASSVGTPSADPVDIDAAWQQVLASLQSQSAAPVPPWPVSEDIDARTSETSRSDDESDDAEEQEDEHYVPPPPPPFPRLQPATIGALLAIVAGLVILALDIDGGSLTPLAIIAILGGVASLVWRMRQGPPTDSGWDDGAVL